MIGGDEPRDLAALVVAEQGALKVTGDPFEPHRLLDPAGAAIGPAAAFLSDLQAWGRPATTQRSYGMPLLRWFRFLWAIDVSWDQAPPGRRPVTSAGGSRSPVPSGPAAGPDGTR